MPDTITEVATQISHPRQAARRTAVQAIAASVVSFATLAAVLAMLAPQVLEALGDALPPEAYAYGVIAVGVIGTVANAIARVMAIPAVNEWLERVSLGAAPRS